MLKLIVAVIFVALLTGGNAIAQTLYIPIDNRPVSFSDPAETLQAAGERVLLPPESMLAGRGRDGDPGLLWDWLFQHADEADAAVVSADSLLYGGLVPSRTHHLEASLLEQRLAKFRQLKQANPDLRIYAFSTVMRTPKMSSGGTDPVYFEHYGWQIFRYSALRDKAEQTPLTKAELTEIARSQMEIPEDAMLDWLNRRQLNFQMNRQMLSLTRQGIFTFFALGRDDNDSYSRTRQELRALLKSEPDLSPASFATFPGADQLGLVLLTRAVNDSAGERPFVAAVYAPGTGADTIPTYQGEPVGESIFNHVVAAGGYLIPSPERADLVLSVNTPANGITLEADSPANTSQTRSDTKSFVKCIAAKLSAKPVAVADIAYGNGADNSFMQSLAGQNLLGRLSAYSGWNTASNTIGFAISQGMLAPRMTQEDRQRLVAARLLDDWAYQANVRQEVKQQMLVPHGIDQVQLGTDRTRIEAETTVRLKRFAASHFGAISIPDFSAYHPWDRMFEVGIHFTPAK